MNHWWTRRIIMMHAAVQDNEHSIKSRPLPPLHMLHASIPSSLRLHWSVYSWSHHDLYSESVAHTAQDALCTWLLPQICRSGCALTALANIARLALQLTHSYCHHLAQWCLAWALASIGPWSVCWDWSALLVAPKPVTWYQNFQYSWAEACI